MSKKLILPSLACLLLFNAYLLAEEPTTKDESAIESHVTVRSRETDPAKREMMRELRAKEHTEEESNPNEAARVLQRTSLKLAESSSQQFMLAPRAPMSRPQISLASFAYPIDCHRLEGIGETGRTIALEDGSHWEVTAYDAHTLRNWRREDTLVITPNYSWFNSYDYFITNKNNNTFVRANLYVGPVTYGPFSHWIVGVDKITGHLELENKMVWCINPQDYYVLQDWAPNDHIIIGLYDGWLSPYDHILINVNMDNHVRCKDYNKR